MRDVSDVDVLKVRELLYRLGITANYKCFAYMTDAICIILKEPESLLLVTKSIYPEVAKRYKTTCSRVEKNIRMAVDIAWNTERLFLEGLARRSLRERPSAAQFLAILIMYFW